MPDLATHAIGGYLVYLGATKTFRKPADRAVSAAFVLGNILPDITTRPAFLLFPKTYEFVFSLHTPILMLLFTILLVSFLKEEIRLKAGGWIFAGSLLHIFLDHLQIHVAPATYWLFPFSSNSTSLGLFGVDDSMIILPYLFAIFLVVLVTDRSKKRRLSRQEHRSYE